MTEAFIDLFTCMYAEIKDDDNFMSNFFYRVLKITCVYSSVNHLPAFWLKWKQKMKTIRICDKY